MKKDETPCAFADVKNIKPLPPPSIAVKESGIGTPLIFAIMIFWLLMFFLL